MPEAEIKAEAGTMLIAARRRWEILLAVMLQLLLGASAGAQFIAPARETRQGGSILQLGGVGSIAAADLDELANSASAQITVVARPRAWIELYGSFNRGAGLNKVASDSFDVGGLLYPEVANNSFLGQIEVGPYFQGTTGGEPARFDVVLFGNFASRRNTVTRDNSDRAFTTGSAGAGLKLAWSIFPSGNTIRLVGGTGFSSLFFANTDISDARIALGRETLPRRIQGMRTVISAQLNALVVEAQFPNMSSKNRLQEDDLTGFQSQVRFYVVGKFLSFGSHGGDAQKREDDDS